MKESNTGGALPHIPIPIIVEGRYDKSAIGGIFSATVITTDGFGIFNSKEKQALIRRLGKDGVIVLTDSDGGGKQIRSFLSGILPKDRIIQLYIPRIEGKERRKPKRSKEGVLGVEGVGAEVLRRLLTPFCTEGGRACRGDMTARELYSMRLTGAEDSAALRDLVCQRLDLPGGMTAKAFLAAVNIVSSREEIGDIMSSLLPRGE